MLVTVKAKTGAKKVAVTETEPGVYTISVRAQPIDGKANKAIINALAKHLRIAPSLCTVVKGATSNIKRIAIST